MLAHLRLRPRTALALRLAWLEGLGRDPSLDRQRDWRALDGRARQRALEVEQSAGPNLHLGDALLTWASHIGSGDPRSRYASLLSHVSSTVPDCATCAQAGSRQAPCDGTDENADDVQAQEAGLCLDVLKRLLKEVGAQVHALYTVALGSHTYAAESLALETGELRADTLGLGVAGEYFTGGRVRLLFSEEFRQAGTLMGYRSIPYLVTHELVSHALWGAAVLPARRQPPTEPNDAFAEGWMDLVAQKLLAHMTFSDHLRNAAPGMLYRCKDDCARYAELRCVRPLWAAARPRDAELADYRAMGREASSNLLYRILAANPVEGELVWMKLSCVWNAYGVRTLLDGVPTEQEPVLSVLRATVPCQENLPLWDSVERIVREHVMHGNYLQALEELVALAPEWLDRPAGGHSRFT